MLVSCKQAIKSQCDGGYWAYYDVDEASLTNGYYEYPLMAVSQLCSIAKLPTNYFNYTPWRCLNGLGPFTNDGSVGHAYGWTNATTATGGTNFSAGRSTWYTTDYGWDGIKAVIPYLISTRDYWTGEGTYDIESGGEPVNYGIYFNMAQKLSGNLASTWKDGSTQLLYAASVWASAATTTGRCSTINEGPIAKGMYRAEAEFSEDYSYTFAGTNYYDYTSYERRRSMQVDIQNMATNVPSTITCYWITHSNGYDGVDIFGQVGVDYQKLIPRISFASSSASNRVSDYFNGDLGASPITTVPITDPVSGNPYVHSFTTPDYVVDVGVHLNAPIVVIDWSFDYQ